MFLKQLKYNNDWSVMFTKKKMVFVTVQVTGTNMLEK
jgi:hypothetical protein